MAHHHANKIQVKLTTKDSKENHKRYILCGEQLNNKRDWRLARAKIEKKPDKLAYTLKTRN